MISISKLKITATSLISREDLQKIVLQYECSATAHLFLSVYRKNTAIVKRMKIAFSCGRGAIDVMLPVQDESFEAVWEISDRLGNILFETASIWKCPRKWTIYVMISSHTDIGLHNSQYIQRYNSSRFIDQAVHLCDETENRAESDRYRYTMEGTWFWNNYGMDRGKDAAEHIVRDYIRTGKLGTCAGLAGNHIQTYGLEEMCRSTYEKRILEDQWGIKSETLAMIDNNGLPMSMIEPYADAGYKNIIFAPNHWNPIMSTVWKNDSRIPGHVNNPESGGGGSRIDVRYSSELPMVFNWESKSGDKLTVWTSTSYPHGGSAFGILPSAIQQYPNTTPDGIFRATEERMSEQLELLESKYPYDIWLFAAYKDDQDPDLYLTNQLQRWNSKWKWPTLRTLGDPDEPFNLLRQRFKDDIPVLKGDITGGWYQHPLTVPELMSQKFDADRALPNAEKWAVVAGMTDGDYAYPDTDFRHAYDALLCNDEHSYGTSGYTGRRVYETWMQHRDWIDKATETAKQEEKIALQAIASHIDAKEESIVVFNPTAQKRKEYIESEDGAFYAIVDVPSFGYRSVKVRDLIPSEYEREALDTPPTVDNTYYRIKFAQNGSICSIYDKELSRELLYADSTYRANELVYTRDNHKSFTTPSAAKFEIIRNNAHIRVIIKTQECNLGAEILQTVTLPNHEKRIDIDNKLYHLHDLINRKRYYRYLYYAFPFKVENCRRLCHLNGAVAEYSKDVTGHGTDVYMAVNEWCCSENDDFGVALMMKDSHITEFDHIHPDKTDFGDTGDGSQIFSYVANDWLQMHSPGGSHLNYRFRYSITSYRGNYQTSKIPQMAERYVNSVKMIRIPPQKGDLPNEAHSFMSFDPNLRFVCLKRADDGNGLIARFYGEADYVYLDPSLRAEPSTVDERASDKGNTHGFITYRLRKDSIRIKTREPNTPTVKDGVPAPIGSVYTGLITNPCAAAGENRGHLYILWGANTEGDISHYKLYRSEVSGFEPCDETFVADVLPEVYRVGRYEDTDLKDHTCYYYRVCAVNNNGIRGEMSEEFYGFTREILS